MNHRGGAGTARRKEDASDNGGPLFMGPPGSAINFRARGGNRWSNGGGLCSDSYARSKTVEDLRMRLVP